jgi:hypothetical protein
MTAQSSPIPPHTPIVVCPTCAKHTAHAMPQMGMYRCLVCDTTHPLAPMQKVHHEEPEGIWCPTCRSQQGVNFWAPVHGQRQCRTCLGWIAAPSWEEG